MPTLIEIFAAGMIGAAIATSLATFIKIWWATKRMDEPTLDETIERLGDDMQRQIEERIGDMSTEDVVRAMMGRRLTEALDEELMTGVEGTTETIPPGTIPYTTSCTVDRSPERLLSASIERMATELVANEAIPWSEAMRRAEENHTIQGTGPLPFIAHQVDETIPPQPWAREQAASPQERQTAPMLEWMIDSCRECSQFIMTNTTIDDQDQAEMCGEGSNEPCRVLGMWLAEPEVETIHREPSDPPPIVYVWMDTRCPIRCHLYDPTHDISEHAQACRACFMYNGWYHGPHEGELDLGGMVQMAEPLPQDEDLGGMEVPDQVTERIMEMARVTEEDLAPSDVQPDTRADVVGARCPWMDPPHCDGCASRVPRLCPQDQAVRCAGQNEPPGQGHLCNIFHTWSQTCSPGHPYLARLRSASACDRGGLVRVIRFKKP